MVVMAPLVLADVDCRDGGYALELLPSDDQGGGRGEYQLDVVNLTSGPGIYRLSAWVKYSSDLVIPPENRTVFHARWWNQEGEIKDGTNKVFDEKFWPSVSDVYQYLSVDFDTDGDEPSWIEWYVGYPLLLEGGSVRLTGLQVQGPDGRRYIKNSNFLWGKHPAEYTERKSYGNTTIVEDCTLPPTYFRRFRLSNLSTVNFMSNINFINDGNVDAIIDISGSFQPFTFGSLSYSWFDDDDTDDWLYVYPNRIQWLDNILIYFDADGFITSPSPKNIIVSNDMLFPGKIAHATLVSGIDFLTTHYKGHHHDFDHTHLILPGLRYDPDDYCFRSDVLNYLPALLFNYEKNDTDPLLLDFTFGPNQPTSYYSCDWTS